MGAIATVNNKCLVYNETNSVKSEWPNVYYYNDPTCQDLSFEYQDSTVCTYNELSTDDDSVFGRVLSYNTYYKSSLQNIPFSPPVVVPTASSNDNNSLSTGGWIGIVIGCAIGVGLIVGILVYYVLMAKPYEDKQAIQKENELNKL